MATVDVVFQGLALVKGANARQESGGLFVELESPMPVGTQLEVVTPEGTRSVRVASVVEGAGAGMLLGFGEAPVRAPSTKDAAKSAEPNAPMAEMKSAPPVPLAEKPKEDEGGDDEPDDPKKKKRRNRRTVIGH